MKGSLEGEMWVYGQLHRMMQVLHLLRICPRWKELGDVRVSELRRTLCQVVSFVHVNGEASVIRTNDSITLHSRDWILSFLEMSVYLSAFVTAPGLLTSNCFGGPVSSLTPSFFARGKPPLITDTLSCP
jgi:hypothetical protein